ncbi:hypothetical protein L1987_75751 [Smallanthus sonchifolius]|uniref:Uncharacterized protein n=1 Tax=Smallanthus sonchifolius TaxID=185202 RepID=A0ACB9A5U6_9ASTR|nr:hypothetical protein L1987_75751 [Smallanthus sonchifolius]
MTELLKKENYDDDDDPLLICLFAVGNIPCDATEEQLVQICEEVGPVVSLWHGLSSPLFVEMPRWGVKRMIGVQCEKGYGAPPCHLMRKDLLM